MFNIPDQLITFATLLVSIGVVCIGICGVIWVLTQIAEDISG